MRKLWRWLGPAIVVVVGAGAWITTTALDHGARPRTPTSGYGAVKKQLIPPHVPPTQKVHSVSSSGSAGSTSTTKISPATLNSAPVYYKNQVIALMYHDVQAKKLPGDVISPTTFGQELAMLRQQNFHVVSLQQVISFLQGTAPIPDNAVLITFDNGYESFYQTVYPMLKKYNDPAVLFAIVRWLSPPHKKGLFQSLNWQQVEQMYHSGLVAVEPQTYNLHYGAQVGPHSTSPASVARLYNPANGSVETLAQYDARVYADVERARQELMARLHEPNVDAMCYPFGDYNPSFVHVLQKAGYRYMFTASFGWGILQHTNPTTLYRIDAGSPYFTAPGLISTIRQIATDTANNPTWHAPSQYVQVWHY